MGAAPGHGMTRINAIPCTTGRGDRGCVYLLPIYNVAFIAVHIPVLLPLLQFIYLSYYYNFTSYTCLTTTTSLHIPVLLLLLQFIYLSYYYYFTSYTCLTTTTSVHIPVLLLQLHFTYLSYYYNFTSYTLVTRSRHVE